MWCHLCKLNFTSYETFKCHVMDKHKTTEDFYEVDSHSDKSEGNSVDIPDDFNLDSDIDEDNEVKEKVNKLNPQESLDSPVSAQTRYPLRKRKSTSVELSPSPCSDERISLSPVITNSESINDDQSDIYSPVLDQNTENPTAQQVTFSYAIPPCFLPSTPGDLKATTEDTLKWLRQHQLFCENMKYPLPASLFSRLQEVQKNIFTQYCMCTSKNELTEAVFKVYEDLTSRIQQHIKSLNDVIP